MTLYREATAQEPVHYATEQDEADAERYEYNIQWSPEDNAFLATCRDFPDLFWAGRNMADAANGIKSEIAAAISEMRFYGEEPPEPTRHQSLGENLQYQAERQQEPTRYR